MSGTVHVVSISTNSLFPRAYLLLDLKHSANLRKCSSSFCLSLIGQAFHRAG